MTDTTTSEPTTNDAAPVTDAAPAASDTGAPVGASVATTSDIEGTILGSPSDNKEGGDQTTDAKDASGAAAAPTAPEKYELTLPDGVTVDQAALDEATPVLQKMGLTNEQASELAPIAIKMSENAVTAAVDQIVQAGQVQRKAWLDEAKADTEIGGGKWDASVHNAAKALDAFGFKEGHPFRKALEETGFGNHPDMIRAFARIGAEMVGEDGGFVRGDAAPSGDVLSDLYPNNRRSN